VRWDEQGWHLETEVDVEHVTAANIIAVMLKNEDSWNAVAAFTEWVLRKKKNDGDRHDRTENQDNDERP